MAVVTLDEVGDGGLSRVYKGFVGEKMIVVKQLKLYSPQVASSLIDFMKVFLSFHMVML